MDHRLPHLAALAAQNAARWPDRVSHRWKTPEGFAERTWAVFFREVRCLAEGLLEAGIDEGAVALFADNRYEWALTDHALLALGLPSVPRGSDTSPKEQRFLFVHSEARWLVAETPAHLKGLAAEFGPDDRRPEAVLVIDPSSPADLPADWAPLVRPWASLAQPRPATPRLDARPAPTPDTLASIIYTSGTSGNPKGVMLTHGNFLHNIAAITPLLHIDPQGAEGAVSILPIWHVYERTFEFCLMAAGASLYYSSVRTLADDLQREKPTIVASVPRVWESIYGRLRSRMDQASGLRKLLFRWFSHLARARYRSSLALRGWRPTLRKPRWSWLLWPWHAFVWLALSPLNVLAQKAFAPLRAQLGGRLRASFSGGGSLPGPIDLFFNMVGIRLVNAYGMTESAPGSITRRIERNVPGSIGVPLDGVEVRIVKEDGTTAAQGEKGLIHVRGANVMRGYFRNPQATAEVLSADGWLNTGDLGALSWSGDYVITGRAKSTIVLVGGENVEPEPIEEKLQESDLIEHAVVVGQDQKGLRAILTINDDHLKKIGDRLKVKWDELWHREPEVMKDHRVLDVLKAEIKRLVSRENGFKPFESITKIVVLRKKFQVGDELTQTLKVKRKVVEDRYGSLLDEETPKEPKDPPSGS